ncbi:MAG: MarR family transcriptional regulator [Methanocorpusculum sp.]|nr:MarR family transcriptional regulator [Methanocorpusculum sp.]
MTKETEQEQNELALKCIRSYPEGIAQSDLWKEIDVDSRTCSRILKRLETDGLIERFEYKKDKTRTYLIKPAKKSAVFDVSLLMAGDKIIPCVACDEECDVSKCPMLEDWVYELVFSEME